MYERVTAFVVLSPRSRDRYVNISLDIAAIAIERAVLGRSEAFLVEQVGLVNLHTALDLPSCISLGIKDTTESIIGPLPAAQSGGIVSRVR